MDSWEYRVLRRDGELCIIEAHYDTDGFTIKAWVEDVWPSGETVEELREDLTDMLGALRLGVVDESELPGAE